MAEPLSFLFSREAQGAFGAGVQRESGESAGCTCPLVVRAGKAREAPGSVCPRRSRWHPVPVVTPRFMQQKPKGRLHVEVIPGYSPGPRVGASLTHSSVHSFNKSVECQLRVVERVVLGSRPTHLHRKFLLQGVGCLRGSGWHLLHPLFASGARSQQTPCRHLIRARTSHLCYSVEMSQ